ncbi:MAG: hypothetical protein R3F48_00155 [Candidatus Zixiibacteriota bacterium]
MITLLFAAIVTLIFACTHKPEISTQNTNQTQKIEESILEDKALAFAIPFLEKRYDLEFYPDKIHYTREDKTNGGYLQGGLEIRSYSYGHPDSLTGERPNYVYVFESSNQEELWKLEVVVPRDTTKPAYRLMDRH